MKTKMTKYQDGGTKKKKSSKPNSRTQVTANGKTRTVTTNEKGKKDYIHTGASKKVGSETTFTGKGDKYYMAGEMNAQIGKPGKVEYSQPGFSKDVDTSGYAAGKKEFTVNTNVTKPGGKTTTKSTKVSRSQVQPMLNRWQSTASKMKTGGMVNPNAKMQAQKAAGSKGVKSGVNPKAVAAKVAKGRSGGTSAAPKTAAPKAKYGMAVKRKK